MDFKCPSTEVEAKSDGKSDTLGAIRKWERTWLMP